MGDDEAPLNPQRRLRHLSGLVARNLTPLRLEGVLRPYHSYISLSATPNAPPFYTSETVFNSINPTWREFDLTQMVDALDLGSSKFVVRLWGAYFDPEQQPPPTFKLMIQWDIDLYGLEFYKAKLDEAGQPSVSLPSDSILVRLTGGYYHATTATSNPFEVEPEQRAGMRRVDRSRVRSSYTKASLIRILTLQRAIQRVRTNTEVISDQTTQCIRTRQEEQDVNTAIERMRMVVETFKEEERVRNEACTEQKARMATQQAAQEASQALIQRSHKTLAVTRDELCEMKDKLRERRQLLWQAKSMETVRQTRIILELSQIFPVLPQSTGPPSARSARGRMWSICRLELPSDGDFSGCDEDEVATALGYVTHLTFMIAKYLDIPFRFPMRPMCSRSTIVDDASAATADEDLVFPLYAPGKNKARFENAVAMLNLNIDQLLAHCSIRSTADGGPLGNLHALIKHFFHLNHAHTNGQLTHVAQTKAATPHPPNAPPVS